MHHTISQLGAIDEQFPIARKLLLVPSVNFGRELLGALARKRGSWIGWEVATPATIAQQLSVVALAERKLRRASDVAIQDAINAAFDAAVEHGEVDESLASLSWSPGTRKAIADAVLELRMGSIDASALRSVTRPGGGADTARSLASIFARYEKLLADRAIADTASVFDLALTDFDSQARFALDHTVLVATPGWTVRGLQRTLVERLVQHGLRVLEPLPIGHLEPPDGLTESLAPLLQVNVETGYLKPTLSMFYAATPADELREIIRRAVAGGYGMDEIEISCTDRDVYGNVIDTLSSHIGASITLLDGLPLVDTRIGRAVEHWFRWIDSDFTADHIRRALEAGDWVMVDSPAVSHADLVHELRRLRIGWGVDATKRAVDRLNGTWYRAAISKSDDEDSAEFERRKERRLSAMDALARLLNILLDLISVGGGNLAGDGARLSVAELAGRTKAVLLLIEPNGAAERATLQRLDERLDQIREIPGKRLPPLQTLAALRQELIDLRAWTNSSNTGRPRRATGGHIHLTNIESAGATGRPLLFITGLDADRTAGPVLQSPLLPESLRNQLNERGASIATIEQRRRERAWQLAIAIGGSDSEVTLSYAVRNSGEGRENSPAPAFLHAARDVFRDSSLGYDELQKKLGEPATAVPRNASSAIDTRDVFLANIADGALLLDATRVAREMFPGIDRGLHAERERSADEAGHFHGLVPAAGILDPRRTEKPVSPTSLETMAACSLRWFYSTALNARIPEEPAFDGMVWLNVMERGSALHRIYERIVQDGIHQIENVPERRERVTAIVSEVAKKKADEIPVSSAVIQEREIVALDREAQLFADSEHEEFTLRPWTTVGIEFGFGETYVAIFPLDDGTDLKVRGRVDRIDRLADGTLRLVDYKSGRSFEVDTKRGAFDGGRKLQLAVYSPAVSRHFDAAVSAAEYRFPTARGEGAVARANEDLLKLAPRIVRSMMDDVAAGRFLPTIDKADCTYCDYAIICRSHTDSRRNTHSPRAEWANAHAKGSEHFVSILSRAGKTSNAE